MKSNSTKRTLVGKILFVYLTSLLILSFSIQAEAYSIVWTPAKIEQTIALGQAQDLTVTFRSSIDLKDAGLWISPGLQPFISLTPAYFKTIKANARKNVEIHFFIPPNTQAGMYYDGTIHLKVGSATNPQGLKVRLSVVYPENHPPVANAGPDQTAFVTQTVTLNGSKSSDVDGDPLTFRWSFTSIPSGSGATLFDSSAVNPTFVVDKPGTYVVQLVLNDGYMDSAPDTVSISTENSKPVANAGPDQTVYVTDTVQLDGSKSTDVDGDLLSYKWSFVSVPAGSSAILSDPASVKPSFIVDKPGTYVAQLIVNDGYVDSLADTVTITTENSKPVANSGVDQTVYVGDTVTLDGIKSSDVDGDPLTFWWSFTYTPSGSGAMLSVPAATSPTFVVDLPGIYVVQLIVNDGKEDSAPKTVTITTANSKPVAEAGPAQTVSVGDSVQLDGSASSDADRDPLSFFWSIISKPDKSTSALDFPLIFNPSFIPDLSGLYIVQLIVNDSTVDSDPDTTTITANLRMVNVPNVVGMVQGDAQSAITAAKLTVGTITQANIPTVPAGCVISQNPLVGILVPEGSPVDLVVSLGPVMVLVPDVTGMAQAIAQAAIQGINLQVGAITTANSPTVPAGSVISQNPLAGSSVPEESSVSLVISVGPMMVSVPNVVGLIQADAGEAIFAARLTVGAIAQASSGTVAAGYVISQTPPVGSSMPEGSPVDLVVSLGDGAAVIGPEGGVVEVKNPSDPLYGFRLEVPPGALSAPTIISVEDLPMDPVTQILSVTPPYTSHKVRYLGGFKGAPDGLSFALPVKATIPVLPLDLDEIPVQIAIDLSGQRYWIDNTDLIYKGDLGVAEITITHFSNTAVGGAKANVDVSKCWEDFCREGREWLERCTNPSTNSDPRCNTDPLQPSYCLLNESDRPTGWNQPPKPSWGDCCREGHVEVKINEMEWTRDECTVLTGKLTVKYLDCPGQPTEEDFLNEASLGCENLNCYLQIRPDSPHIPVCGGQKLGAYMVCVVQDKVISTFVYPNYWFSSQPDIAEVDTNGFVTTKQTPGATSILAKYSDLPQVITTVTVDNLTLRIQPGEDVTLLTGQNRDLQALCGSGVCPKGVFWRADMPGVVSFVDLPDGGVRVKAENPGTTNVFANSNCISSVGALITVTVIDPPPAGGYTIMWQATMSKNNTTTSYLGNQSYMVFTVIIDGDWTGEVVFDGYYQIQSFTSIGTVNRKEVDRRVFEECGRESVHEFVHTSTTTGPGLLPIQLNIVRGNDSQGSYIYDPFLGLNNPAGYFNVPSSISYTIDVTGYSGCGDDVQPLDGHFGDSFAENTFGFETVPGVLRPTTSDPTMFMKSNTVTYSDTKTVTWDIIVIVSP